MSLQIYSVVNVWKDSCQSCSTLCSRRATKFRLFKAKSRQLFNISKDGESTMSLIIFTFKNISCFSLCPFLTVLTSTWPKASSSQPCDLEQVWGRDTCDTFNCWWKACSASLAVFDFQHQHVSPSCMREAEYDTHTPQCCWQHVLGLYWVIFIVSSRQLLPMQNYH